MGQQLIYLTRTRILKLWHSVEQQFRLLLDTINFILSWQIYWVIMSRVSYYLFIPRALNTTVFWDLPWRCENSRRFFTGSAGTWSTEAAFESQKSWITKLTAWLPFSGLQSDGWQVWKRKPFLYTQLNIVQTVALNFFLLKNIIQSYIHSCLRTGLSFYKEYNNSLNLYGFLKRVCMLHQHCWWTWLNSSYWSNTDVFQWYTSISP